MTTPYKAIVQKQSRTITGMDADGKYCLDGNEKLEITPLEPETFKAFTLREVAKLTFTGGRWLLDEIDILGRWLDPFETPNGLREITSESYTDMKTVAWLYHTLDGLPPETRTKIKGVAWFDECFDSIEGETAEICKQEEELLNRYHGGGFKVHPKPPAKEYRPVLLADFWLASSQPAGEGNVKPSRSKTTRPRQPKPVARFENDFAVAVIPIDRGEELNLSLEPELRSLVKGIISAGGRLSRQDAIELFRTKHGKAMSENYQPEKLLRSKIATKLMDVGLLGTNTVRTTTFWAKQQAG